MDRALGDSTVESPSYPLVIVMSPDPALRLTEIAAAPGLLPERGEALLAELRRHLPFDAAWIALAEPFDSGYVSLASTALDQSTVQYLSGPKNAHDIEVTGLNRDSAPLSPSDLPYPVEELPTWSECLIPTGIHEALAVPLFAPGPRHVGFMALLTSDKKPPAEATRDHLGHLAPVIAQGIDPVRTLLTAARVVQSATAGVLLSIDGDVAPLPGIGDDPLLARGSGVLDAARAAFTEGHIYTSFMWPRGGTHAPDGHVRVTVLSGTDVEARVLPGAVLLSPSGDLLGLTPRELEVLGMLVEGWTNQEIASALVVAPRTVAAHVEHILVKLGAASRTLAAVRAVRTGLFVPAGSMTSGDRQIN